jgi:hypothetical protein
MKNHAKYGLPILLAGTLLLQGCQTEDTTPPIIHSVFVNDVLGQDFTVAPGDSLRVKFSIMDDYPLSQMKANIHDASDGHSHNGIADTAAVVPNVGLWTDMRILPLSGTTVTKTLIYVVPDTIQGVWHWELQAVDVNGNSAEEFVVEFDVQ